MKNPLNGPMLLTLLTSLFSPVQVLAASDAVPTPSRPAIHLQAKARSANSAQRCNEKTAEKSAAVKRMNRNILEQFGTRKEQP